MPATNLKGSPLHARPNQTKAALYCTSGWGKKKAKESIAFGPFLCVGSAISFLCGEALIRWYLGG